MKTRPGLNRITMCGVVIFLFFSCFCSGAFAQARLLDDFNSGSFYNLSGGNAGGDEELPGTLVPSMIANPAITLGHNGYSLQLSYDVSASGSFSFFWMKLGKERGGVHGVNEPADLSGMNYLSFYIRGASGKERIKLEIHQDTDGDGKYTFGKDLSSHVYVEPFLSRGITADWQKVVLFLNEFKGITDWKSILEMVFVVENQVTPVKKGELYLDNIVFGLTSLPFADIVSRTDGPAVPQKAALVINESPAADKFLLSGENQVVLQYPQAQTDPSVEYVRFEYQMDDGSGNKSDWITIGYDYTLDNASFSADWHVIDLKGRNCYDVRAVAVDIKGNESASDPLYACIVKPLTDEEFLAMLSHMAFKYFWDNQNPQTGLFMDTSGGGDASTASTGFGLSALCIGVENRWVDRTQAEQRAIRTLETFLSDPSDPDDVVAEGKYGFFYHFLHPFTAERAGASEISTVDTAILLCGALTAGEYFGGKVKELADRLYAQVDWPKFLVGDDGPEQNLFSMGWSPERGFLPSSWDYYTDEAILINLLAIGSPTHPVPSEVFYSWLRRYGKYGTMDQFIYCWHGALFAHQYGQAWFYLKGLIDGDGVDWYTNSRVATMTNRQFCIDNSKHFKGYGPDSWGVTSMARPEGYTMHHGVPPTGSGEALYDGTISPTGPAGSMPFTPIYSLRALRYLYHTYPQMWGRYGMKDSMNLDKNWYAPVYYGIGEGIFLLGIENFRTGMVWAYFMKNERIKAALQEAGFRQNNTLPEQEQDYDFTDVKRMIASGSGDTAFVYKVLSDTETKCVTQGDYNTFVDLIKTCLSKAPAQDDYIDWLRYLIAKARVDQVKRLLRKDTLESGRTYLQVNDALYAEALEVVSKLIVKEDLPPALALSAEYLFFWISREQFNYQQEQASFARLVQHIDALTADEGAKLAQLNEVVSQLNDDGLFDYGLELRVQYASRLGTASLDELLRSLRKSGNEFFDKKQYGQAKSIHDKYVSLVVENYPDDSAQPEAALHIIRASGDVTLLRAGKAVSLACGTVIASNDLVRVGENGAIDLGEGGGELLMRLTADAEATFEVVDGQKVHIALAKGKLLAQVRKMNGAPSFEVRTPTAVGGIRGSAIGVMVTPGESVIANFEGMVTVNGIDQGGQTTPGVALEKGKQVALRQFETPQRVSPIGEALAGAWGVWGQLIEHLREFLRPSFAVKSVLSLADQYLGAGEYDTSLGYYQRLKTAYPDSTMLDYVQYQMAQACSGMKQSDEAMLLLNGLLETYPDSPLCTSAYVELGRLYYLYYRNDTALAKIDDLLVRYPHIVTADHLHLFKALLLYAERDYEEAINELQVLLKQYPATTLRISAVSLIKELEDVLAGKIAPRYAYVKDGNFRIWSPSQEIQGALYVSRRGRSASPLWRAVRAIAEHLRIPLPHRAMKKQAVWLTSDGFKPFEVLVRPGEEVSLKLVGLYDHDTFAEYQEDRSDLSRLPKKMDGGDDDDLLSLEWWDGIAGSFTTVAQQKHQVWTAPDRNGLYKVEARISDLGLVRVSDKGVRDDIETLRLPVTFIVAGKPCFDPFFWGLLLLLILLLALLRRKKERANRTTSA